MLSELVAQLGAWNWWILGLLLAAVEIFAPGAFFIWFAIAAVLVGTLALVVVVSWPVQILLFAALSAVAVMIGRQIYGRLNTRSGEDPFLNDRAQRQVGRVAFLEEPIVGGLGRARLDDTIWRVEGPDLPAGAEVRVVAVRAGRLAVEAAAHGVIVKG